MSLIALVLAGLFAIFDMPLYAVTALSVQFIIMIMSLYGLMHNSPERKKIESVAHDMKTSRTYLSFTFILVGVLMCWFAYSIISNVEWQPSYLQHALFALYTCMVTFRVWYISKLVKA